MHDYPRHPAISRLAHTISVFSIIAGCSSSPKSAQLEKACALYNIQGYYEMGDALGKVYMLTIGVNGKADLKIWSDGGGDFGGGQIRLSMSDCVIDFGSRIVGESQYFIAFNYETRIYLVPTNDTTTFYQEKRKEKPRNLHHAFFTSQTRSE